MKAKKADDYEGVVRLLEEDVIVVIPGPLNVNECEVYCLTDDATDVREILNNCFPARKVEEDPSSAQVAVFRVPGKINVVFTSIGVYLKHR